MEHSHSSNYIRESESEQTVQGPYVRILIDAIGDVVRALLEVLITELSPSKWEWRVCDRYGTTIMGGFESSRPAAKYRGNRALFLLLASGCDREPYRRGQSRDRPALKRLAAEESMSDDPDCQKTNYALDVPRQARLSRN